MQVNATWCLMSYQLHCMLCCGPVAALVTSHYWVASLCVSKTRLAMRNTAQPGTHLALLQQPCGVGLQLCHSCRAQTGPMLGSPPPPLAAPCLAQRSTGLSHAAAAPGLAGLGS